jgi:hypothetical protein
MTDSPITGTSTARLTDCLFLALPTGRSERQCVENLRTPGRAQRSNRDHSFFATVHLHVYFLRRNTKTLMGKCFFHTETGPLKIGIGPHRM